MTYFDIVLIAFLVISAGFGLYRGFIIEVISVASYVLSFVVAIFFAPMLLPTIQSFLDLDPAILHAIAYVLTFIVALIVLGLIKRMFEAILEGSGLASVDRMFGMIFGALRGFVLFLCCAFALSYTQLPKEVWWTQAEFSPIVENTLDTVGAYMPEDVQAYWHFFKRS